MPTTTAPYTYPTPTLDQVYAELVEPRSIMVVAIDHARRLIADSNGFLTWFDAGETWASLHRGDPKIQYPAL